MFLQLTDGGYEGIVSWLGRSLRIHAAICYRKIGFRWSPGHPRHRVKACNQCGYRLYENHGRFRTIPCDFRIAGSYVIAFDRLLLCVSVVILIFPCQGRLSVCFLLSNPFGIRLTVFWHWYSSLFSIGAKCFCFAAVWPISNSYSILSAFFRR